VAAPGLEPFSEDMESAVFGYFTGKAAEEFLVCIGPQVELELFVHFGLGGLYELEDFSGDEAVLFVVFRGGVGVIPGIQQVLLDVRLEILFQIGWRCHGKR